MNRAVLKSYTLLVVGIPLVWCVSEYGLVNTGIGLVVIFVFTGGMVLPMLWSVAAHEDKEP